MEANELIDLLPDIAENRPRRVPKLYHPESVPDVQDIVRSANKTRTPLYAYSTGKNWGVGSKKPVVDDCMLVDLGRMNAIRELDVELGIAVIEPGVTQADLAERLRGSRFMLNVTTSCRDSSILGNALDRGEGSIRPRTDDLLGLEVVLGTGALISTGVIRLPDERKYHSLGTGPDFTQVFCQSNFGIVTAGAFALIARPERIDYVSASFDRSVIVDVADAVARLVRERVFDTTVRFSDLPFEPGVVATPEFTVFGPVMGRTALVESRQSVIGSEFSRLPGFRSVRFGTVDDLTPQDPLHIKSVFFGGVPSCDLLRNRFAVDTCDLDGTSPRGWSVIATALPLQGAAVQEALDTVRRTVDAVGLVARVEVSLISARTINLMTQVWFERNPAGIERMRRMRQELRASLRAAGYHPARDSIDELRAETGAPVEALARVKAAFDPNGIISPGRYV